MPAIRDLRPSGRAPRGGLLGHHRPRPAAAHRAAVAAAPASQVSDLALRLQQQIDQLTADNRTLDERLQAARTNLRFHDKRIADLEAQLAPPGQFPK